MFEVLIQLLPLLIGGAVAAFFGGLLGIGGGVIITPMMVWYLSAFTQIDEALIPRMAVATSLAVIAGTAATGCYTHHCVGRVDWRMVSRGWLPLAIGSFSGAWLISSVPHEIGIATVGIGLLVLGSLQIVDFSPKRVSNMGTPLVTGGAWGVGSISSYIGIGGGVLVVPLLRAVGYTMKDAIGTSSASSFVLAFAGTLSMVAIGLYENPGTEGALGNVYYPAVLTMWLCGPYISILGARSLKFFSDGVLRAIFVALLVGNASYCLYKAAEWLE